MSVLRFRGPATRSGEFNVEFAALDQCGACLDVILMEIVPLALKDRGLDEQVSRLTLLSGDFRARLLELYSILDQVIQLLDMESLDGTDLISAASHKNLLAINCLSDACYVMMMFNDAKSYTSPDDINYYLKLAEDYAQSSIKSALELAPKSWVSVGRLAASGIIRRPIPDFKKNAAI